MARVLLLSEGDIEIQGRLKDMSGRGVSLYLPRSVPLGDAVRIDIGDTMLLAEVCHCAADSATGEYLVGLELDQAITAVSDLKALVRALVGESSSRASVEVS